MVELQNEYEDDLDDECEDILDEEGNALPKRCDKKYKEIKNFELYELTQCIVYEMAMRNEEVMNILSKLDYIEKLKERHPYLTLVFDKLFDVTVEEHKKYKEISRYSLEKMKDELEKLIDEIKARNYRNDWVDKFETSNDAKNMNYSQMYKYIYGDLNIEDDNTKLCEGFLRIIVTELQNDLVHNYFIYPDGYIMNFQGAAEEYLHEVINKELDDIGTTFVDGVNESVNKGFFVLQEMYKYNQTYAINQIIPNFKRKINNQNEIVTLLNFSLPTNELVDYVKHIKEVLDGSEEKVIKSYWEFLNKELGIKTIDYKNMTSNEWADCFYIYDYFKDSSDVSNKTIKQKVQEALTEYNGVKVKKTTIELKKSKNKNDQSRYKIVQYKEYRKKYPAFKNNKNIDQVYKTGKEFKNHKPFYSYKTIDERNTLMKALIEELKYKSLIIN